MSAFFVRDAPTKVVAYKASTQGSLSLGSHVAISSRHKLRHVRVISRHKLRHVLTISVMSSRKLRHALTISVMSRRQSAIGWFSSRRAIKRSSRSRSLICCCCCFFAFICCLLTDKNCARTQSRRNQHGAIVTAAKAIA